MSSFDPYEGDEFACVDDYPEHDYELFDEADGERVLHCRRCGAETVEESDDVAASDDQHAPRGER